MVDPQGMSGLPGPGILTRRLGDETVETEKVAFPEPR